MQQKLKSEKHSPAGAVTCCGQHLHLHISYPSCALHCAARSCSITRALQVALRLPRASCAVLGLALASLVLACACAAAFYSSAPAFHASSISSLCLCCAPTCASGYYNARLVSPCILMQQVALCHGVHPILFRDGHGKLLGHVLQSKSHVALTVGRPLVPLS